MPVREEVQTSQVIRVDADVRAALDRLRELHGLRNYSAVIRLLLEAGA